jgi:hypothetical protein
MIGQENFAPGRHIGVAGPAGGDFMSFAGVAGYLYMRVLEARLCLPRDRTGGDFSPRGYGARP